MAAPTWAGVDTGLTDAGGAWTYAPGNVGIPAGGCAIFQVLQDGATAGAVALTSATHVENLAGTDNAWTSIGAFDVGSPTAAIQHLWIGRRLDASGPTASGSNSTSEDLYMQMLVFADVNAGTTLATVIENSSAGTAVNGVGTSASASDTGVTTLEVDRLAINLLAINDDNPFAGFTGETGGTWTTRASYAEASGTDGAIYLIDAPMTTAGTIDGGTGSITDSDAWGVVGFALIGTTPGGGGSTYTKAGFGKESG